MRDVPPPARLKHLGRKNISVIVGIGTKTVAYRFRSFVRALFTVHILNAEMEYCP
jgi:hypothetical protein